MKAISYLFGWIALGAMAIPVCAQTAPDVPPSSLVSRSTTAIGFTVGGGSTKVDLKGTDLAAGASGEAKVQAKAKAGLTNLEITVEGLTPPSKLGAEYLTYVLWAVTPDGRTGNAGELLINKNGEGKLNATTAAQTFSLIITAEPYFAVRVPSEMVVLDTEIRKNTKGKLFPVGDYKLMKRGQYERLGNPLAMTPDLSRVPLEMYEARNALDIARSRGADKNAPEIYTKARASLENAESLLASGANKKQIISTAKQTVQFSEDARALAAQREDAQRIAAEREAAAAKARSEAEARAAQEAAEAKRKSDEEAQRQSELAAAKQAQMKAEADAAAYKADTEAKALREKEEAANAEAARAQKATTDTPRGLQVNMGDVLFDTGKFNLRAEAQVGLAKFTGIVLSHPGLNLSIEGYTDNVGSETFNQKLSEQRSNAVRDYLVQQSLDSATITAKGYGMLMPVASNDTAQGRQQNRRVEIIISGEVIGSKIGSGIASR
jgi:outer membrane protein OmpA-like peptidoglycan-associated protein